jgi:hypothetical protein
MIRFECPECDEKMEVNRRMAGRQVRCVGCQRMVEVPNDDDDKDRPISIKKKDVGLSGGEYALYTLLFLFIPCANVLVSSILYYVWRAKTPRRANQINMLGFMIFGLNILVWLVLKFAVLGQPGQP